MFWRYNFNNSQISPRQFVACLGILGGIFSEGRPRRYFCKRNRMFGKAVKIRHCPATVNAAPRVCSLGRR